MKTPIKQDWTIERIQSLTDDEISELRKNAIKRQRLDISALCEVVLQSRPKNKTRIKSTVKKSGKKKFEISPDSVEKIANKIRVLPSVESTRNAQTRLALQDEPLRTLQDLWRLFLICGFSSQENSEENGPLAKFVGSDSSLLQLETVKNKKCDEEWVLTELKPYLPRQLKNKVKLVIGAYPHFIQAGGPQDLLKDLCEDSGALKLFCDLSRGQENDKVIHDSSIFSRRIDHEPFPYIGNKQIRNILVNSGLSHNVVPLDSRWQNFFGDVIETEKSTFSNESNYLALEDLLRNALIVAQQDRPDIVNLSVLDAIVFAHMSKSGKG